MSAERSRQEDAILRLARERGVPLRDDHDLAQALARLAGDAGLPQELLAAIAATLAWACEIDAETARAAGGGADGRDTVGAWLRTP